MTALTARSRISLRNKDLVDQAFSQVTSGFQWWAAGTRTQDRRIMSPDGQQSSSGHLTWADTT